MQEGTQKAPLPGVAAFWRSLLPSIVLAAAGAFAFHELFDYDPYRGLRRLSDGTEEFFFAPSGASPLLISMVTLWLLYNRRFRIRAAYGQPAWAIPTVLLLALASGAFIWATYVAASDLLIVSLIFTGLGAGAWMGGRAGLRSVWLPCVFPVLLVPPPAELINDVILPLQLLTAEISVWILGVLGIPALQVGDQILTGSKIFQVIEACAGLRSIETMTMSGVLYAELFYRGRLQAGLIIAGGPLLGFVANQVRVLSLILNPYSQFAAIHTAQGIVMLVGGVLLLAVLDWGLSYVLPVPEPHAPKPLPTLTTNGAPTKRLGSLVAFLVSLGMASLWFPTWSPDESPPKSLSFFPVETEGWRVTKGLNVDREFLGSVGLTQSLHRRYERDGMGVDIFVGSDRRLQRRASLISGKTEVPGSGWITLSHQNVRLEPDGLVVDEFEIASREGRRLVYHWREGTESVASEALRSWLGLDQSPLRRPGRALVYRVSTPLSDNDEDRASAEQRLGEFATQLSSYYRR